MKLHVPHNTMRVLSEKLSRYDTISMDRFTCNSDQQFFLTHFLSKPQILWLELKAGETVLILVILNYN